MLSLYISVQLVNKNAVASSVHRYGYVLGREDSHVLRRAFEFEIEVQRR